MSYDAAFGFRAAAAPAWRWCPGMKVFVAVGDGSHFTRVREDGSTPPFADLRFADLQDPATLGCLVALVREAWWARGRAMLWVPLADGGRWDVIVYNLQGDSLARFAGASEAEAWVNALEGA